MRVVGEIDGGALSIVDVTGGQLLDVVAGRDAQAPIRWLTAQPSDGVTVLLGALWISQAQYRRSFEVALLQARSSR